MKLLFLAAFLLTGTIAMAQQPFTEGTVTYAVSIGAVNGEPGFTEHAGTYTLTVKGKQMRRELKMNNGYQNVLLQNGNTGLVYSLQSSGGQQYAVQLDPADLAERQKPYRNFMLQDEPGTSTIAGQECKKTTVIYKNGSRSEVYCATGWTTTDSTLFDRYPGIKPFPLSFEYRNEDGIIMQFHAEKMEAKPVESASYRVPPGYKVISNREYKLLKK